MRPHEAFKDRYAAEIALTIIALATTLAAVFFKKLPFEAAVIVDVIVAALALSVALTKQHFTHIARILYERERLIWHKASKIGNILESLTGKAVDHAHELVDSTLDTLERAKDGFLSLDSDTYFRWLIDEMNKTEKGDRVLAVSSISTLRWTDDPRQANYFQANVAATGRQVEIHRIFLVSQSEMHGENGTKIRSIINEQKSRSLSIGIVWYPDDPNLHDDFVLFENANVAYKDEHDPLDPTRVLKGEWITNQHRVEEYRAKFRKLTIRCLNPASAELLLTSAQGQTV